MPFYPAFNDSPLKDKVLEAIPVEKLEVGMTVAVLTPKSTPWNVCVGDTFRISQINRITPKKTKVVLSEIGDVKSQLCEFFVVTNELRSYITEFNNRYTLLCYIRKVQESENSNKSYDIRRRCDRLIVSQVLALSKAEAEKQLAFFRGVFNMARAYTKQAEEIALREKEEFEKKYGVKKY